MLWLRISVSTLPIKILAARARSRLTKFVMRKTRGCSQSMSSTTIKFEVEIEQLVSR